MPIGTQKQITKITIHNLSQFIQFQRFHTTKELNAIQMNDKPLSKEYRKEIFGALNFDRPE
jgi:hypothetical protein